MEFKTIVADDYDSALRQARTEYGSAVRVHARRDFVARTGLHRHGACEITFYLVQPAKAEEPEPVPPPGQGMPKQKEGTDFLPDMVAPSEEHRILVSLLQENDFGEEYIEETGKAVLQPDKVVSRDAFEMQILEHIVDSVAIDHDSYARPPHFFVLLGPTGVGKTTTLVKIAMFYGRILPPEARLKVAILTLDSFRAGAYAQVETFCKALELDLYRCKDEEELSVMVGQLEAYDLVLVDTMGKSPKDGELALRLKALLSVLPKEETGYFLAVSASHKRRDMERYYRTLSSYEISSMVVTKTDETENIGNILSFAKQHDLPLLFMTDGQKVPQDLHKASNEIVLGFLQGFSLDFSSMGETQSPVR
jgi:flagellar biosynthesis protein FlhF